MHRVRFRRSTARTSEAVHCESVRRKTNPAVAALDAAVAVDAAAGVIAAAAIVGESVAHPAVGLSSFRPCR